MLKPAHTLRPAAPLVILWLLSAIIWHPSACAQAPASELDLRQYIAELQSASDALDGQRSDAIRQFREGLPSEWAVRIGSQLMRIRTDWLAAALLEAENGSGSDRARVRQAREHLAALQEAAEALSAPTDETGLSQSRGRIDHILQDREFQGSRGPSWLDNLKARVFGWIARQLQRFFGRLGLPTAAGSVMAWILISLAFLLVAWWCVRALLSAASRSEMDLSGAAAAGQDWRYWAEQARSAADRGDYRSAIHAAYWAAVARLEEKQLLPQDRSRTPREALRLLQRGSTVYAPLAQLTGRFELTWYGYRSATSADWNDAMHQLETLGCLASSIQATAGS